MRSILCHTKEYITQIVIHNLPMKLHCIHCKNLVQLGASARATHVQPIMTWKGHNISVCKSTCEACKRLQKSNLERLYYIKCMKKKLLLCYIISSLISYDLNRSSRFFRMPEINGYKPCFVCIPIYTDLYTLCEIDRSSFISFFMFSSI